MTSKSKDQKPDAVSLTKRRPQACNAYMEALHSLPKELQRVYLKVAKFNPRLFLTHRRAILLPPELHRIFFPKE